MGETISLIRRPDVSARHPELVSGSIRFIAASQRRQSELDGKVMPIGVFNFDKIDFPLPMPALQVFLARNCSIHRRKKLVSDERFDAIARCETFGLPSTMLPQTFDEVGRNANVKRSASPACEDVDARASLNRHKWGRAERWTLKQVQGDGTELS